MHIETLAIHAGNNIDERTGAVIQPITLSTTFQRTAEGLFPESFIYTRADNPNRRSLENAVAKLEGGADACAFSSGNAAGCAVFQSLGPGSHVIAPDDMYHGLRAQLLEVFEGILDVTFVDMSDLNKLEAAIRPETRLIWIETPSNPLLKVTDIRSVVRISQASNIRVACDNTFSTPVFQRPIELGCDLVMHSSTKYLGGHSDVLGGIVVTKQNTPEWDKIRAIQVHAGAVPSPFDCYMTVRGIKTLPYRMKGHAANAMTIAKFLKSQSAVSEVYYPGLADHADFKIANAQMSSASGMLSFLMRDGEAAARKFVNSVNLFSQATSLGGVESLIEHRASLEGPDTKTPRNLIRISVGLEHIDDLIKDLDNAFKLTS